MKKYTLIFFLILMSAITRTLPQKGLSLNKFRLLLKQSTIGIHAHSITIAIEKKIAFASDITRTKQYDFHPDAYSIQIVWQNIKTKKTLYGKLRRKLYKRFSFAQIKALVDAEIAFLTST